VEEEEEEKKNWLLTDAYSNWWKVKTVN
jgi:hypothetical protein